MSKLRVHAIGMSIDGSGAGPNQSLENPLGMGGVHCTSGRSGHGLFTEYTASRVGLRMLTTILSRVVLGTLARGSLGGTCLDRCVVLGPMRVGGDGGVKLLPFTHPPLCLPSCEEYFGNEWRDDVSSRHRRHSRCARTGF